MEHNYAIDTVKGILILLVIIGHLLLGSLEENVIRGIIYSFHMPLFLFISGYLLDIKRISSINFLDYLKKYWHRLLFPWLIAWCIFTFLNKPVFTDIFVSFLYPYAHLWYIPTLFGFITIIYVCSHFFNVKVYIINICLFCIGILFIVIDKWNNYLPCWIMFQFYSYIAVGLYVRGNQITLPIIEKNIYSTTSISFLGIILLYFLIRNNDLFYYRYLIYFLFNIIIMYCIYIIIKRRLLVNSFFIKLGQNSLDIYLWHMLPIFFLKRIFGSNHILYYIISVSVFIFIFYILNRKIIIK